ncbi:hypothetical protein JS756_02705 [Streptomyces actuosus]|uniref:Uncharacterized protein n=1 Tax=Streptomyces actuosus TaxID=1885 RepID=A0ABS2VJ14_STRAS|nr:hypothetical protein [Streptomyces actuosus]MBN0043041.1 hypothetical protein [Streptomyces actuosus]
MVTASFDVDFPLLTGAGAHLHDRPAIRAAHWMLGTGGPAQWAAAPGTGVPEKFRSLPGSRSPRYPPSVPLTLETGTAALVTAALVWLGGDGRLSAGRGGGARR